jgi:hypothetical protein
MTGQIVSDLTLILLSDFKGYNPKSRKNALSPYRELSAIRHCCIEGQAYVQTHIYSLYLALWDRSHVYGIK